MAAGRRFDGAGRAGTEAPSSVAADSSSRWRMPSNSRRSLSWVAIARGGGRIILTREKQSIAFLRGIRIAAGLPRELSRADRNFVIWHKRSTSRFDAMTNEITCVR